MAEFDQLSVLLPPELAKAVRDAVDGERYVVESDVVIDALQDWQVKQKIRAAKLERFRELIAEGLASGSEEMSPDDIERIKREGRALLAARRIVESVLTALSRSAGRGRQRRTSPRFGTISLNAIQSPRITPPPAASRRRR